MSNDRWVVQLIAITVSNAVVGFVLLTLSEDEKHAIIAKSIQHELIEAIIISLCYSKKMLNRQHIK